MQDALASSGLSPHYLDLEISSRAALDKMAVDIRHVTNVKTCKPDQFFADAELGVEQAGLLGGPLGGLPALPGQADPLAVGVVAWQFRRLEVRAHRREKVGCHSCGYDRSGLAVWAACPECGTARST